MNFTCCRQLKSKFLDDWGDGWRLFGKQKAPLGNPELQMLGCLQALKSPTLLEFRYPGLREIPLIPFL